jgi:hypothetical protein
VSGQIINAGSPLNLIISNLKAAKNLGMDTIRECIHGCMVW